MSHVCASVTLFAQCCFKQIRPQVLFNSKLEVYKSWGETAGHLHILTPPDLANLAFPNCSFMFQCLHFSLRLIVAQSHHSCSCLLFIFWEAQGDLSGEAGRADLFVHQHGRLLIAPTIFTNTFTITYNTNSNAIFTPTTSLPPQLRPHSLRALWPMCLPVR